MKFSIVIKNLLCYSILSNFVMLALILNIRCSDDSSTSNTPALSKTQENATKKQGAKGLARLGSFFKKKQNVKSDPKDSKSSITEVKKKTDDSNLFILIDSIFKIFNNLDSLKELMLNQNPEDTSMKIILNGLLSDDNKDKKRDMQIEKFKSVSFKRNMENISITHVSFIDVFFEVVSFLHSTFSPEVGKITDANKDNLFMDGVFKIEYVLSATTSEDNIDSKTFYEYGNTHSFDFLGNNLVINPSIPESLFKLKFEEEDVVYKCSIQIYPNFILVDSQQKAETFLQKDKKKKKSELPEIIFYQKKYKIAGFVQVNKDSSGYNYFVLCGSNVIFEKRNGRSEISWEKLYDCKEFVKDQNVIVVLEINE